MSRTRTFSGQEGFTLAGLIVILTIIMIIVTFTVPEQWSIVMGRERDRQTIFLMKQYARAIREWSRKHSAMPTSLDQLVEARRPRFMRGTGKWPCPITGKEDDWILVPPGAIEAMPGGNTTVPPELRGANLNAGRNRNTANPNTANPNAGGGGGAGPSKLRPDMSPKDYVGPFIGVRPNAKGPSYIAFKGSEDYSEWVYTVQDLEMELSAREAALQAK